LRESAALLSLIAIDAARETLPQFSSLTTAHQAFRSDGAENRLILMQRSQAVNFIPDLVWFSIVYEPAGCLRQ
jgi:hypothetical protein